MCGVDPVSNTWYNCYYETLYYNTVYPVFGGCVSF